MMISTKLPTKTFLVASLVVLLIAAAKPASAADWKLDPSKSTLGFSGMQTGAAFQG